MSVQVFRSIPAVVTILLLLVSPAAAQTRHALVIGIDDYRHVAPLQKARNDARAVSAVLDASGFSTRLLLDPDRRALLSAFASFIETLRPGDEAIFYFAGHGVEVGGRNILLAADIPALTPSEAVLLDSEGLPVDRILAELQQRGARASVLIIDACRNNPFPDDGLGRGLGATRGLARVQPPAGAMVVFSAGSGQEALDRLSNNDPDPNSVFTRKLLPLLSTPGLPMHEAARRLRNQVEDLALRIDHRQRPAIYDEMRGDFVLLPTAALAPATADPAPQTSAPASAAPSADPCAGARADWAIVGQSQSRAALWAILDSHPNCPTMAALARARLDELAAAASQPAPAPAPVVQPMVQPVAPTALLRPWCGAASLNVTERTICNSPILANLDEQLGRVFQQQRQVSAAEQHSWLRSRRDGCGEDAICISEQVIARIALLSSAGPVRSAPAPATARKVPGSYRLVADCYIVIASRASMAEAEDFARARLSRWPALRVFESANGWYGISVETTRRVNADARMLQLMGQGLVPSDSYCSNGVNYVAEVILAR